MSSKKVILTVVLIVLSVLFILGITAVLYLNSGGGESGGFFNQILNPFKASSEPVNVLLMGGDKVAKNTDTIMLVNYNPSTAKVNVLSIPRDTKVKLKGTSTAKINAAYPLGGAELAVDTVSNLLNVKIKYFVFVDTVSFRKIIDILGGVDFYVPVDMDYDDPLQNLHVHLKKGQQHLDGAKAEQFMRFRQPSNHSNKEIAKFYDGSDLKRIEAQQSFIKEFVKQKVSFSSITKLNEVIKVVFENVQTNVKLSDALKMARGVGRLSSESVNMMKLPGRDSNESSGWYYVYDKAKADEIIKQYFIADGKFENKVNKPAETNKTSKVKNNDSNAATKPAPKPSPKPTERPAEKPAAKPSETTDITKDNPSNSDGMSTGSPDGAG